MCLYCPIAVAVDNISTVQRTKNKGRWIQEEVTGMSRNTPRGTLREIIIYCLPTQRLSAGNGYGLNKSNVGCEILDYLSLFRDCDKKVISNVAMEIKAGIAQIKAGLLNIKPLFQPGNKP